MRRLLVPFGTSLLVWTLGWICVSNASAALPADAVPDSASAVLRWKAPQTTLGKVADFVDAVQPGIGDFVRNSLPEMGQGIGNPGLTGVDVEQDFWAIVFAQPHTIPTVVFVLTAKDVDDLKDGLDAKFQVHVVGKVVAYSEDEDALGEVRKRMDGEGKPLWSKIDAASKKLFDSSDVSVLLNVKQLGEDFEDEIAQAEPQLDTLIDQITQAVPEPQRAQMEVALGIYRDLGKAILRGIKDTNSLVATVSFTPTAIRFEDRLQVSEGTPTAKILAGQPAGDLALIGKLPTNKAAYVGIKANMAGMIEWSMNLTKNMMKDATEKQRADIDAATKEMSKLKYDEMAMYFDLSAKSPAVRGGAVTMVTPTKQLREISQKLLKNIGSIETIGMKQKTVLEPNAAKIGGIEVDRVTITQEFDDNLDPTGLQKKMQTVLFGDAGMQQLIMYQANRTLQTFGGGTTELQNLVTALDSTKPADVALTAARKKFPEKLNVLVLVDAARLMVGGFKLAAQEGTISVDVETLDGLHLEPSFFGFSLTCDPTSARGQFEIPLVQIQNIAKLVPLVGPAR